MPDAFPPAGSSLNLDEILLTRGEYFAPGRIHYHYVFDAYSPLPWDVRARFHSDHHSGLQHLLLSGCDPGSFVDFQSYSMPRRVRKISS